MSLVKSNRVGCQVFYGDIKIITRWYHENTRPCSDITFGILTSFFMEKMNNTIIIKIGSSILLTKREKLDEYRIAHLANQVRTLQLAGYSVVLVVSGAVGCGARYINTEGMSDWKQYAAGIGQMNLTATFEHAFRDKHIPIAQMLILYESLQKGNDRDRIKKCLQYYASQGVVAFINENDVLQLNSFGGNDFLAAELAILLEIKLVIMLSSMQGARYSVGGGESKVKIQHILSKKNIQLQILDGKIKNILVNTLI